MVLSEKVIKVDINSDSKAISEKDVSLVNCIMCLKGCKGKLWESLEDNLIFDTEECLRNYTRIKGIVINQVMTKVLKEALADRDWIDKIFVRVKKMINLEEEEEQRSLVEVKIGF